VREDALEGRGAADLMCCDIVRRLDLLPKMTRAKLRLAHEGHGHVGTLARKGVCVPGRFRDPVCLLSGRFS
jgi:hypothetical protein